MGQLLDDADGSISIVEFHHTIGPRIGHPIGEYDCRGVVCARLCGGKERIAIEEIVSKDQPDMGGADELPADQECFRNATGFGCSTYEIETPHWLPSPKRSL